MIAFTFDMFLQRFKLDRQVSYEEFCRRLSVLNGSDTTGTFAVRSDLATFIARVSRGDSRPDNLERYMRTLYRMLVVEPEVSLRVWFDTYCALTIPINDHFHLPSSAPVTDKIFQGRTSAKYGRICKSINFDKFYNTKKLYANDFEYTFGLMRVMFEDFKIRNSLVAPAFFEYVLDGDYKSIWGAFMMGANRASVFNPATYRQIVETLFEGTTLFAPCMGWNAYQLGFYSTDWAHFISTDVIPEVVQNGHDLHALWEGQRPVFFEKEKTVDLYCCPSEQLDTRHGFVKKYANQVDAVLFSPPYYDLEIYDSPEQSLTSYPNYQEWLHGYWEETVKLCAEVLRPGGRFAFVISNYRNKQGQVMTISEDMRSLANKHIRHIDTYQVQWSAIKTKRQAHKTRGGNFEDLWLFEKT